ncbi:MAG: 3'-5' exonuclease [Elusimicrobiota bacterium]
MRTKAISSKQTPLEEVSFCFVDTETTGISPARGSRVCELAILRVRNGQVEGELNALVDPQSPIDPYAQAVHGITDAMVAGQPTFEAFVPKVETLFSGAVFVGHNANFDVSFLRSEFERAGRGLPELTVLDTLRWARRHYKFPSNRLGALAEGFGFDTQGAHRAGRDVELLKRVFDRFVEDFRTKKKIHTLEGLITL